MKLRSHLSAAVLLLPLVAGAQTVTITNPAPNAVSTDRVLTAAGTAQFVNIPNYWFHEVGYSLNGGPWQSATGSTNWSAPNLVLTPGLNSFRARVRQFSPYEERPIIGPTNEVLFTSVATFITQPRRLSSSQFVFTINGASNSTYTVQVSTNLASTNWYSLFSLTLTNNQVPVVDSTATNRSRFYRVVKN